MPKLFAFAATLVAAAGLVGCGGGKNDAARTCFDIWNGSSNTAQQAKVARRFPVANVSNWTAQASGDSVTERWTASPGKSANLGGSGSHGCGYLFHTSRRFVSYSAELRGDSVRWVPRTLHGSWSRPRRAAAPDNASVDADGLLSPRTAQ
jgi:hypothetical protein